MLTSVADGRFLIAPKDEYVDSCFSVFFEEMPDVDDYHDKEVASVLAFVPKFLNNEVKKELPEGIEWNRFHDSGVDVYYKKHDKSHGVKLVLEYFNIPKRTIEDWESERRNPPQYLVDLIEYKLKKEKLIF